MGETSQASINLQNLSKLCRLCLASKGTLINIKDNLEMFNIYKNLISKTNHFEETLGKTKLMSCNSCFERLKTCNEFIAMCCKSAEKIDSHLKVIAALDGEIKIDEGSGNKIEIEEVDMKDQIEILVNSDADICHADTSENNDDLKKPSVDYVAHAEDNQIKIKQKYQLMTCLHCREKTELDKEHICYENMRDKVTGLYSCKWCKIKFRQRPRYLQHIKSHEGERPHICQVCGKSFQESRNLNTHMRVHTNNKRLKNVQVRRITHFTTKMASKGTVVPFTYTPSNEPSLKCSHCDLRFKGMKSFKEHQEASHKNLDEHFHECSQCPSAFKLAVDLANHVLRDHEDKTSKCEMWKLRGKFASKEMDDGEGSGFLDVRK